MCQISKQTHIEPSLFDSPHSKERIALAKFQYGWEDFDWLSIGSTRLSVRFLHGAKRDDDNWYQVPLYHEDLAAVNKIENMLTDEQLSDYGRILCDTIKSGGTHLKGIQGFWAITAKMCKASAEDRVTALIKSLNLTT